MTCLQLLCHRIPLVRKKSLRQKLIEHGLLNDFLKNQSPNPASKYFPQEPTVLATQSLKNYMDVSPQGWQWGSSKDAALEERGAPRGLGGWARAPRQ